MSGDDMGKTSRWQGSAPWAESKLSIRNPNGIRQSPGRLALAMGICYHGSRDAIGDSKLVVDFSGSIYRHM